MKQKIFKDIYANDLTLEIKNNLIFGDIHIGYEEALNKTGHLVPRFQFQDTIKRLEKILSKKIYDSIILNGDIKHEFGTISNQEWRDSLKILDLLSKHTKKVILIKGNHDTILGPIGEKKELAIVNEYTLGEIYICHGHIIPKTEAYNKSKIVIIGHEHPSITLHDNVRTEKFKCFLIGNFEKKTLIVMPSFNLVTTGTDILSEQLLSPFLTKQKTLDDFSVFLVEDKVYAFGKVKKIKR